MLVVAGRSWADGFAAQAWIERVLESVGQLVQERLGFGGGGQDAAHGGQGEGAEADGSLQGLEHVGTLIMGQQGQELLRLQFALDLLGQESFEELQGDRSEFAEALLQEQGALARIVLGMMALALMTHPCHGAGHQRMAGDLLK